MFFTGLFRICGSLVEQSLSILYSGTLDGAIMMLW